VTQTNGITFFLLCSLEYSILIGQLSHQVQYFLILAVVHGKTLFLTETMPLLSHHRITLYFLNQMHLVQFCNFVTLEDLYI